MNKINKDDFIRSLKMFFTTFIFMVLIYIIISKLFYSNKEITINSLLLFASSISLGSSIGYFQRYKKYSTKIIFKEVSNNDIIIELKEVMKDMHWSIQKVNSAQIVFKSSFLRTSLTEYLMIDIYENSLELTGPEYYVEKVVKKLRI